MNDVISKQRQDLWQTENQFTVLQEAAGRRQLTAQEKSLLFQVEQAEASKRELVAGGLKVSQLEDEDQWKKVAIEKVWPEMADFVGGKDAINEYLKACGKQPWN